ncbi:8-amino-7-oxononanoate synthase [mine drainage metagenome]|uniref:8-amino-7-oxononanoate synthase n=1 Tax=mine drainage metagenome TaxID=410659 RepID=A0A1J5REH7_9ZZZZ
MDDLTDTTAEQPAAAPPRHGLAQLARGKLLERLRSAREDSAPRPHAAPRPARRVPEALCRFDTLPAYERLQVSQAAARRLGVDNPFFRLHDARAGATTRIGGREYINFSSYDYLGLNGHPRIAAAVHEAVVRYGTSASASRLVAGERPIQRELEQALADVYGTEAAVVFVSGHATNVSTIAALFGPKDLIVHDALAHNSIVEGAKLSGAHRRRFAHNDPQALDELLSTIRGDFERVLVVIEGLYSMDGDTPDLARFVDIKRRHQAFLMVDEAHALGTLGATGRGIAEHCGVPAADIDIWMGTLSKTLASCGGYVAGSHVLVDLLKYTAPGFVYSVGIPPAQAAAALEALHIMQDEPERVAQLQDNGRLFLAEAKARGIDTGLAQGHAVSAAIIGSSLKATKLSNLLFERGINAQPIIHPAVEEKAARLRFFLSADHPPESLLGALDRLARAL